MNWLTSTFRNPIGFVLIGAVLALCLSSYPIIFLGKSYVSPGYGPQMLYDGPPYVPGYRSTDKEDLPADAGAMPWQNLPYSRVQHQAVFEYGEFPLWNRYNSAGLPLFGQGQSQFLDPLHWIAVAGEGNGWAWDLKFLLSKLVFLAGIGACILLMTGNRVATIAVTISAAFIGFFYFRFNHPVYFNLTYAPWIVYGYLNWVRAIDLRQNFKIKKSWAASVVIIFVASMFSLFGGTPKEGSILFGALHFSGLIGVTIAGRRSKVLSRNLGVLLVLWIALALATTPHWLIFLDTLSKASTSYDNSNCNFASRLFQFVDTLFWGPQDKPWSDPNINTFIFVAGLGTVVSISRWFRQPYIWMLLIPLVGLLSFAYGIVPNSICQKIPFVGVIHHIHHTFFSASLVFAILLAGLGMASMVSDVKCGQGHMKWSIYGCFSLGLLVWWAYPYYGTYEKVSSIAGQIALVSIVGTTLLLLVAVWFYRPGQGYSKVIAAFLVCLFVVIHSYHGLHINTGIVELDDLLINPTPRADLLQQSPAIAMIQFGGAESNEDFIPDRYITFNNRSELIAEVLQIARDGGGSEKDIVLFENDLRQALSQSTNSATAEAHVKHYLKGVGVRSEALEAVLVVDDLRERNKLDLFNKQLQIISREPYRVIGEGRTPMSGFYSFLHLESLNGPDALMSSRYMDLLDVFGWPRPPQEAWLRTMESKDITKLGPLLDLLNVGYFLTASKDLNIFHLASNIAKYGQPDNENSGDSGFAKLHLKHHPEISADRVSCAPNKVLSDGELDSVFSLEIAGSGLGNAGRLISAVRLERVFPVGVNHTGGRDYVLGVSEGDSTAALLNSSNGEVRISLESQQIDLWLFGCADGLDKLGAEYIARVAIERDPPIKRMFQQDMSVWLRNSPWPRAFYVDSLASYTDISQFAKFVHNAKGVPLAAFASERVVEPDINRIVVSARNYQLTSNTTSFSINVPGPGIVVLSEVNVPGDVQVFVNQQPGKVLNVNHTFRGVEIPKAGDYDVTFTYRPQLWTTALSLSAGGHLILIIMLISFWRTKKN
ncbi:MAG: hypothetical protein VYC65_01780 [Chloroflexota bacterium]|nr:hypothetical protein [Chloroflexota bacterium]